MMKWTGLFQNKEFQFRAAILSVIMLFMAWQFWTVRGQKQEITNLIKDKERKHASRLAKKDNKSNPSSASQTSYRLEGTTMKDGTFQALINGAIYKVGDIVDSYKVTEITLRSSTLQNPYTHEIRRLNFSDE